MSQTGRKTLRNTILLAAFNLANPLLSLLLFGTLTRTRGAEGVGAYNLLINFFFVAHSFTSLGLNTLIIREVSRKRESATSYLCSSATIGLLVALLGAAGVTLVVRVAGYGPEIASAGWLIGITLLPSIVILYSESIFIAYEKVQYIVLLSFLENSLKVAIGVWLLRAGFGVTSLIVSFAALRWQTFLLHLILFHRRIAPLSWSYDSAKVRELIRSIPVFGTILIVAALYSRTDVFLLSKMASLAAVGYYAAAYRLYSISQVVPASFNTTIYPVFSNLFSRSPESYLKAKGLSLRYLLVVLLPISAGVSGLAEPIVRLLFGQDFSPSVPALRVVMWTLVPYGVTKVLASVLFASNRQSVDLKVNVMSLGTNVLLNVTLIPRFGFLGCAWATFLSICFFLACQCFFLRKEILSMLREAEILRPGVAAGAILVWLYFTPIAPLGLRIAGGAMIYIALLFLLRVVRFRELKLMLPERFAAALPGKGEL